MKKTAFILMLLMISSGAAFADFTDKKAVAIGKPVDDFTLKGIDGQSVSLSSLKGKPVMLVFWSAQCPFVVKYEDRLAKLAEEYAGKGVAIYGIDSNKTETPEQIQKTAAERKLKYPILLDPGNKIADQFGALTTPHIFIMDAQGNLAYEGAVDDQGWGNDEPKKHYVREALDALLSGAAVPTASTKSVGCTVKRK